MRFFESHVRPLLAEHCYECHGPGEDSGGVRLDSLGAMLLGGDSGPAIAPGDPDGSLLMEAVRYEGYEMPPSGKLPDAEIEVLRQWIAAGAPWPGSDAEPIPNRPEKGPLFSEEDLGWWAIQPLTRPKVPMIPSDFRHWLVKQSVVPPSVSELASGGKPSGDAPGGLHRSANNIDRFIASKLHAEGLTPSPLADKRTLIRRAYFDMLGVPPSQSEINEFLADQDDGAWGRLVDRLLDDDRYGERWARHWLDLVRYADSDGYRADGYRPNAWRYRDWVIDALNADMPYDKFLSLQIAGDEIAPDDPDALIATGFLQHGIYEWNSRDAEGQRDIMIGEMTDVVGDVFMGIGMQCAKCHDHKFDPILQKDYFALRAFFEPIRLHTDKVIASDAEIRQHAIDNQRWLDATETLREQLDEVEAPFRKSTQKFAVERFPADLQPLYWMPDRERTGEQQQIVDLIERQVQYDYDRLAKYMTPEAKAKRNELQTQLAKFDHLKPKPLATARVVSNAAGTPPTTMIPKKRTEVSPGFLAIFGDQSDALVVDETTSPSIPTPQQTLVSTSDGNGLVASSTAEADGRRTRLARWLGSDDNPLTTRVIVNRVWQHHFGSGLAPSPSDFGRLGEEPSHPELLDYLVQQFLQNEWRLKPLHRMILMSQTFRQSAIHPDAARQEITDPSNRLVWRADTRRLDAEQIRDSLLTVTGELSDKRGGPGSGGSSDRRSIYVSMRRNSQDPLLGAFDLPRFFTSTPSRDRTTSPLQSLLLLNSKPMFAHAEMLAKRSYIVADSTEGSGPHASATASIDGLWQRVFGRPASDSERAMARRFLDQQADQIAAGLNPESIPVAKELATASMPTREGKALKREASQPFSLLARSNEFQRDSFTIEAFIVVNSVYNSGSVRTIASTIRDRKAKAGASKQGWSFGVTGKGSRRRPQTLVMHMFGDTGNGSVNEAAIFSDQHIELNTPYYVAAAVTTKQDGNGEVRFIVKDLSDDNRPAEDVVRSNPLVGKIGGGSIAIGSRPSGGSVFDGIIDDVRYSSRPRSLATTLHQIDHVDESTVAYWSFDQADGADRSGNHHSLKSRTEAQRVQDPDWSAWVDLCHILLNSNEFLYVR